MAQSGSASEASLTVRFGRLDAEARAVAAADKPIHVPGVLPGEIALVAIEHDGKRARFGRLIQVVEAAPERVDVPCAHFLDCGGCDFLHATLPLQHTFKRQAVADALGVPLERVEPVVATPAAFGYRALAKAVIGEDGVLGSYRPRSHDIVDMSGCLIHAPAIEALFEKARSWLKVYGKGDLRYLVTGLAEDSGQLLLTIVAESIDSDAALKLGKHLALLPDVAKIVLKANATDGDVILGDGEERVLKGGEVVDRSAGVPQSLDTGAFVQVNPRGAKDLYRVAVELAQPKGRPVFELYAGSGGLTLALLAGGAKTVTSIEAQAPAVEAAQRAASLLGLSARLLALADDANAADYAEAPVVVVNPPRKGLREVVYRLAEHSFERLVYVSCNPTSLAKDLAELMRIRPSLVIERIVPVDLFPQTLHIETVVSLTDRG